MIEAIQWTGDNLPDIRDFVGEDVTDDMRFGLTIQTLEGPMSAQEGDYIIKGVKGEFYPCKPDIFEATYESEPDDAALDTIP